MCGDGIALEFGGFSFLDGETGGGKACSSAVSKKNHSEARPFLTYQNAVSGSKNLSGMGETVELHLERVKKHGRTDYRTGIKK